MDIWHWLERLCDDLHDSGMGRAVDLIYQIPSWVNDEEKKQVDAAMPEALSLARSLKNPWLEVYFRHWGMRHRLSNCGEGEKALNEAVSLIEFAHRDETFDCPQSICVTQDMAAVYGNIDGPGWGEERLAICAETLDRINPKWPCFDCISREYADALCDLGRFDEAIRYLDSQQLAMRTAGENPSTRMDHVKIQALRSLGKIDEALALLDQIEEKDKDDHDAMDLTHRAVLRARLYALAGRFDEAQTCLPPWRKILPFNYLGWAATMHLIAKNIPEKNDWYTGSLFQEILNHQIEAGAYRNAITIASLHAELAIQRSARSTALRAINQASRIIPKLKAALDAPEILAKLEKQANALTPETLPNMPAEEIPAWLEQQENRNPETDIEWLLAASEQAPTHQELAVWISSAYQACGLNDQAKQHLWHFLEKTPSDGPVFFRLLDLILTNNDVSELNKLTQFIKPHAPIAAHWGELRHAFNSKQWQTVAEHAKAILSIQPDALNTKRFWAQAALNDRDVNTCLQLRQEICASEHKTENDDWDLLVAASAAQAWKIVRQLATQFKIPLQPSQDEDDIIEEHWSTIRIQIQDGEQTYEHLAQCTGPATARILSISGINRVQHIHDWVVFDPAGLETPPEDPEAQEHFMQCYRAQYILTSGGFGESWLIDGAHPGESALNAFTDAISKLGWEWYIASDDDYTVLDPENHEARLPGCYMLIALPLNDTLAKANQQLEMLTKNWQHPFCWLKLAQAAKVPLEKHWQTIETYGL